MSQAGEVSVTPFPLVSHFLPFTLHTVHCFYISMATLQPSQEDIDSFVRTKGYTPEKLRTVLDWVGRWGLNALVTQWMYGNASKPLTLGSDHSRFSSRPPTPCFDHPNSGGSLPSGSSNQETSDTSPASSDDGNMPAPQPNGLDQSLVPFWGRTYLVDRFANRSVSSESAVTELSAWSPNLYSEQQWAEGAYLSRELQESTLSQPVDIH